MGAGEYTGLASLYRPCYNILYEIVALSFKSSRSTLVYLFTLEKYACDGELFIVSRHAFFQGARGCNHTIALDHGTKSCDIRRRRGSMCDAMEARTRRSGSQGSWVSGGGVTFSTPVPYTCTIDKVRETKTHNRMCTENASEYSYENAMLSVNSTYIYSSFSLNTVVDQCVTVLSLSSSVPRSGSMQTQHTLPKHRG